jgi:hypothetical protein
MNLLSFRTPAFYAVCHRCGNALTHGEEECPHCGTDRSRALSAPNSVDFNNGAAMLMPGRMFVPYPSVPEEVDAAMNIARARARVVRRVAFGVAGGSLLAVALALTYAPGLRSPVVQRLAALPEPARTPAFLPVATGNAPKAAAPASTTTIAAAAKPAKPASVSVPMPPAVIVATPPAVTLCNAPCSDPCDASCSAPCDASCSDPCNAPCSDRCNAPCADRCDAPRTCAKPDANCATSTIASTITSGNARPGDESDDRDDRVDHEQVDNRSRGLAGGDLNARDEPGGRSRYHGDIDRTAPCNRADSNHSHDDGERDERAESSSRTRTKEREYRIGSHARTESCGRTRTA